MRKHRRLRTAEVVRPARKKQATGRDGALGARGWISASLLWDGHRLVSILAVISPPSRDQRRFGVCCEKSVCLHKPSFPLRRTHPFCSLLVPTPLSASAVTISPLKSARHRSNCGIQRVQQHKFCRYRANFPRSSQRTNRSRRLIKLCYHSQQSPETGSEADIALQTAPVEGSSLIGGNLDIIISAKALVSPIITFLEGWSSLRTLDGLEPSIPRWGNFFFHFNFGVQIASSKLRP